ncbi:hypothetical protein SRB5_12120 [Streptomyces sp. RB5]|uniref:Uncharacterized protein n=1 Tax=Streptomyces smaragdinus TaxID=2585196 RepID=A0A7K0CCD0_9ACTN|nr:hypothetical protein [Streptomyces smaragdinus]
MLHVYDAGRVRVPFLKPVRGFEGSEVSTGTCDPAPVSWWRPARSPSCSTHVTRTLRTMASISDHGQVTAQPLLHCL